MLPVRANAQRERDPNAIHGSWCIEQKRKDSEQGQRHRSMPDLQQVWTQQLRGLLNKGECKGKRGNVQLKKRGKVQFCTSWTQITWAAVTIVEQTNLLETAQSKAKEVRTRITSKSPRACQRAKAKTLQEDEKLGWSGHMERRYAQRPVTEVRWSSRRKFCACGSFWIIENWFDWYPCGTASVRCAIEQRGEGQVWQRCGSSHDRLSRFNSRRTFQWRKGESSLLRKVKTFSTSVEPHFILSTALAIDGDAKHTSLLNNASKESSSDLNVTVPSTLLGLSFYMTAIKLSSWTRQGVPSLFEYSAYWRFFRKPTPNIFNALVLERILHVSENCDPPAARSRIVPVVKPTPGFQSLTFSIVSVHTIRVASRAQSEVRVDVEELSFQVETSL